MERIERQGCAVYPGTGGSEAPIIYVIDLPEHPFGIAEAARGRASAVARVPVASWNDSLTPWPAAGLRANEGGFGGHASETLRELMDGLAPALEADAHLAPRARAICGYSLGGLFALYAFCRDARLAACASLSGSLWYEGFVDWMEGLELSGEGRFAFFSLGRKEPRAGAPIMRRVQTCMERCAELCRIHGCTADVVMGPGNHMQHHQERLEAGIAALDGFLNGASAPRVS